MIPLHNKFNLYTIPNNSLHLNLAISQIPLPHLPKMQQSLPIKSTYHSPISTKIITQITPLEVHNLILPENTSINCVKFSHNSNRSKFTQKYITKNLKCQIDTSRCNYQNFISHHLQEISQKIFQTENLIHEYMGVLLHPGK